VSEPRLAELLASLGVATDVAAGLDMETSARATVLAIDLARELGLRAEALRTVYYTAMLRFVGCTSLAAETAAIAGGDDLAVLGDLIVPDAGSPKEVLSAIVTKVGRNAPPLARAAAVAKTLANPKFPEQLAVAHCEQAVALAEHLGAPAETVAALGQIYERFDGKGGPHKLRGEQIVPAVRIVHVALRAEIHRRIEGTPAALAVLIARRNTELDGTLVDLFLKNGARRLARVEDGSAWDLVLEAEPKPHLTITADRIARVAEAFARFADLKSPYTLGHSEAVASRAVSAAEHAGMPAVDREQLRVAALLHDLGRVAIPNGIWDKRGQLTAIERERVHEHAAHTQKILARTPLLAEHARLAGSDHERLDGSGYARGVRGAELSLATNLLAASDVYQALLEDRPHRPAHSREAAARLLTDEAAAGRLDRDAVRHVLTSADAKVEARATYPCNLTEREVEILRLIAQGLSNKEIGARLHISPRTAGNHIAHIFEKTKLTTRAAAALFAVQHRLIVA